MSNPYLLSPNYPNQPSLSSRALCRTTKSMIPPSAGQFGLIYKGSIHSSQKLIIFYPKFFKKTRFLLQATLPAAIRGRGRIRVEFVAHCRNSALFESNPSILFSFGTRSGVTSSVTIKATAPAGGVEPPCFPAPGIVGSLGVSSCSTTRASPLSVPAMRFELTLNGI